jgi:hypothetical protein
MFDRSPIRPSLVISIACIALVGCASAPAPVASYTPQFSYQYPASAGTAADVTIAIVRARDAGGLTKSNDTGAAQHALAFNEAMTAQFQELLNKRGFKQRGPFDDLNSMTFPDKKGSDLTLTSEVNISVALPKLDAEARQSMPLLGSYFMVIKYTGPCTASGFVSFLLLEPLSGEKIWVKKVDVPPTQVDCSGEASENDYTIIKNGVGRVLEKVFPVIMQKAWDYLSTEEVVLLKNQSQELRTKKVY